MKNITFAAPFLVLLTVVLGCAEQARTPDWQKATVLAEKLERPSALTADEDFVYFVTGGTIAALDAGTAGVWRVKTGGGVPEQLFKARRTADGKAILPETFRTAVDEKYVYWSSGTLWRTPKNGGESERLAPGAPTQLVADEKKLYWKNFAGENAPPAPLYGAEKGATEATALTKPVHSSGLAVDADFIYWTQRDGIYKMKKTGGDESKIFEVPAKQFASGLAADAENLYFTVGDGRNALVRISKNGGETKIIANEINIAHGFYANDGFVYFVQTEGTFGTSLVKAPASGGNVEKLDSGYISAFCVGQTKVFVADSTRIYSLNK